MWPRCCVVVCLITSWLMGSIASSAPTPDQIEQSIERGKKWLYSRQKSDSTWEMRPEPDPDAKAWTEAGGQWGGLTALSVYALLATGESHNDPRLVRAIDFLKSADITGTYALSLRMQVWSRLPQTPETRTLIRKDLKKLLDTMNTDGSDKGQHDYQSPAKGYSHSRSNYALLGIWTAAQCDVEVPANYWKLATESWIANQDASGGWSYKAPGRSEHPVTPGMTAAGVATLFIAQDFLYPDGNIKSPLFKQSLDRGMKWLGDNFGMVASNQRFDRDFPYPTLYGVERVGLASGLRYIGDEDWYEKIATWLLAQQMKSGAWHRSSVETGSLAQLTGDTAFALLTLARGRAPVAFAKLDYSPDPAKPADWNARPRDIANVTRYIGRQIEREVNWHIVTLRSPIHHWHESAVLYLAGSKPPTSPPLSPADKDKLRQFVEEGGLIFATADLSSRAFSEWYRKLGAELFPGREWRELPAEHPIFTAQQFPRTAWKTKPSVLGLSNGVRELMILLPVGDAGRWWQSGSTSTREEIWQLATNVHQYSAGREGLRLRGQTHTVAPDESIPATRTVRLARLEYAGNWNPEPGGWRRLAAILHNRDKLTLEIEAKKLGDPLDGFSIAHLTGTDAMKLDESAVSALRAFIESGGTLLVDAAGGSAEFATSIEAQLHDLLPGAKLSDLPPEHAMLISDDGKPIEIAYRPFARRLLGNLAGAARLQCLKPDDRPAVIYSREDLSNAFVGATTDGVIGYAPAPAAEMLRRLILSIP